MNRISRRRQLGFAMVMRIVVAFSAAAPGLLAPHLAFAQPKLEVRFFNIGQGDATLVTCPHGTHRMLIDCAELNQKYSGSEDLFKAAMEAAFDGKPRKLQMVVASHPHSDHIGSMEWVLNEFEVKTYVDNGDKLESGLFGRVDELRQDLEEAGRLDYINAQDNPFAEVPFCSEVKVRLLQPWATHSVAKTNDRSVAVRIAYKDRSFLFTGDVEKKAEKIMTEEWTPEQTALLDVDVLKVSHHGAETSSTPAFLHLATPEYAVISCGKKNTASNKNHKHPRIAPVRAINQELPSATPHPAGTIDAYASSWKKEPRREGLWVTTADGAITIRTDGSTIDPPEHEEP
jgi:competence protein ComEC